MAVGILLQACALKGVYLVKCLILLTDSMLVSRAVHAIIIEVSIKFNDRTWVRATPVSPPLALRVTAKVTIMTARKAMVTSRTNVSQRWTM